MIRFPCSKCQREFAVDNSFTGRAGNCSWCGAAMTVPQPYAAGTKTDATRDPSLLASPLSAAHDSYLLPASPEGKPKRMQQVGRQLRLPLASGKSSALVLVLCFALSAGLVYLVAVRLHLPVWIRWELILGAWWLVWVIALTRRLYRGLRVSDDHQFSSPRNWFKGEAPAWTRVDFGGGSGDGCFIVLGVLLIVVVAIVGFWFLVEVAIPAIAFFLYFLVRGMLARVVNDFHGCTGNFGRALRWGATWASIYTAPLAVLVWVGHLLIQQAAP